MDSNISPELFLVLACAAWPPSELRVSAIRRTPPETINWNRVLQIASRHQVMGLVRDGVNQAQIKVPVSVKTQMDSTVLGLIQRNLELAAEALRLQRLFDEAHVPVLFLKGSSLAVLAYGNLGLRESKDIDLFVPPAFLAAAEKLVEKARYRRFDPPADISDHQLKLLRPLRKDFGYAQITGGSTIELHWRLFSNPYFMNQTTILTSARMVPISSTEGLRTLGPADLFAYLCAHGAQHWWYQLKWLADVAALLSGDSKCQVEQLYQAAELKGVGTPAAQAILLCRRLLGLHISNNLEKTLYKRSAMKWIEATALRAITAGDDAIEPGKLQFGTTRGSISCFLLGRGWRYWLAEFKVHLICEADVLDVLLPRYLHFLYPILRLPLWCRRHFARSNRPSH